MSGDPFEAFNRVVLAICDEEDREATVQPAELKDSRYAPIPLMREARQQDRKGRFEASASTVFQAAVAAGIPRDEAEAKVKAVARALENLMAEPWWQRVSIGTDGEKEAAVHEMAECLEQVHDARQAVYHLGLALPALETQPSESARPASAELTPPAPETTDPLIALLRVFTKGVADDRIKQASQLLTDDELTANEKLTKIDALIPFPPTASGEDLGELLGVTKQAILQTPWWDQNRKGEKENEISRRRVGHQKRAKEYESPRPDADDE